MTQTPNYRLKKFFESIPDSFELIAEKTGVSRRTWQRLTDEGVSITSDKLLMLEEIYGIDSALILTGRPSQSVDPDQHTHEVNEEGEKYKAFKEAAPKGSNARSLSVEHYDNPIVVMEALIKDIKEDWNGPVRNLSKEERMEYLKEAMAVIEEIASRHSGK